MRYLYIFLFYLALPIIFLRLLWRSRRLPGYRKRLIERLGFYPLKLEKCIWVHAVSVGEAIAAIPLIKAIKSHYPALPIVVTTMTPTGATHVKTALGDSVTQLYIPFDLPDAMGRFLRAMNPLVCIIMETELWPNLLAACRHKQVPVCLVNARLSEKSAAGYRRVGALTREMLRSINAIAAHGEVDAERFIALGATKDQIVVTGNIKFDLDMPADLVSKCTALRESIGKNRFVWIAASTHEGEEEIILAVQQQLREKNPQTLLILVPRHPDRFEAVAKLCEQSFVTKRRSLQQACTPETAVYLGDTMGELLLLYGVADVAFVGGSLIKHGGHNMLEPAALGKPILTGPHLFNFAEISDLFMAANAMAKVNDASSLVKQFERLMKNEAERAEIGRRALQVMQANRGAMERQMAVISKLI